jgi:hypothetical protein
MNNSDFNISKEWEFIYQESVNKAPKLPLSAPLSETREILLKIQVILGQYENEQDIKEKDTLLLQYIFLKNLYSEN